MFRTCQPKLLLAAIWPLPSEFCTLPAETSFGCYFLHFHRNTLVRCFILASRNFFRLQFGHFHRNTLIVRCFVPANKGFFRLPFSLLSTCFTFSGWYLSQFLEMRSMPGGYLFAKMVLVTGEFLISLRVVCPTELQ